MHTKHIRALPSELYSQPLPYITNAYKRLRDGPVERMLEDLSLISRTYMGAGGRLGVVWSICYFRQMETGLKSLGLTVQST